MLFCVFYIAFLLAVNAMHNVTVDDNDASITYQPPGSWVLSVFDSLDAGGQHHVTSDPDATASFTFTGVAIYFYSPLWTFQVTTLVTLDSLPPVLLDLRDYTQPLDVNGPETVQSSVVWSQTDLANTQHTLLVSVGPGQTLAILDTLVYTVLDANDISSSSSSSSSSSTSSTSSSTSSLPSAKFTPHPSIASINSSRKGLAVTLGVVCTVFALLVISSIWWFIRRGQRRDDDDYDHPQTHNDTNHSPQMSDINNTSTYYSSRSRSSRSTSSRGRDARFRSMPTEAGAVTNARRTSSRPTPPSSSSSLSSTSTSTIRHSAITPSKLKNSLTTIPEALRETSLARHTSKSPVRDRKQDSLSSPTPHTTTSSNSSNLNDEREEAWTYPQPVIFASVT